MVVALSQMVWTFPGGKKTIQKGTAVAGNVATTKTVPAGKIWLLLNVAFELTTDATAADRLCKVQVRDSVDVIKFSNYALKITASLTEGRYFTRENNYTNQILNGLGVQILDAGEDVYLSIVAGVAGDAYGYLIEYLEIDA